LVDSLLLLAPFALYPKTGAFSIFITGERIINNKKKKEKEKVGLTVRTLYALLGRLAAAACAIRATEDWRLFYIHHR